MKYMRFSPEGTFSGKTLSELQVRKLWLQLPSLSQTALKRLCGSSCELPPEHLLLPLQKAGKPHSVSGEGNTNVYIRQWQKNTHVCRKSEANLIQK